MDRHPIFYFGCWDRPGHFLWAPDKRYLSDSDIRRLSLPTAAALDGSRLFLPRPEKKGTGTRTYLPAPHLTILAWWGNPWDSRGAVNSAIIAEGKLSATGIWRVFTRYFPELSAQLAVPLVET